MQQKLSLLLLLVMASCLIDACSSDSTFCYEIDVQEVNNFNLEGAFELMTGDTVMSNQYAIVLRANDVSVSCMLQFDAGGTLRAEDPANVLQNPIENISIRSNADISPILPAGSELGDLFQPTVLSLPCLEDPMSTPASCQSIPFPDTTTDSLTDAFNAGFDEAILFQDASELITFIFSPAEDMVSNLHEFTVQFDFADGTSVPLTTEAVFLAQ